jgi:uncharacterized protein (TIGR00251 family)
MAKSTSICLRSAGSGCSMTVYGSPNARETKVTGINQWRKALEVDICASPREDEANEELIRFLSERLSVPKDSVRIMRGAKSRLKVIQLPLSVGEVEAKLGGE